MRSSEWQLTQLSSDIFCCSLPGMLRIHSPFDIWWARFLVFVSLTFASAVLPAATSTDCGPSRS